MEELFSIIVEFPDSQAALEDLAQALAETSQLPQLVAGLRAAFGRRLLHQGAHTADILAQYIATMRALHIVDRSGGATRAVAAPLCEYLRNREDTVRRVVAMFVDESGDLFEELSAGGDEGRDDVFSRLVDIYGSKDLLVAEYRNVLAERLLSMASYDTERETRVLELLKQRFGEACMQHCYIMLKDLTDSRRLDEYVESRMEEGQDKALAATIVSHLFWPSLKEEELRLPPAVAQWMEAYTRHYQSQRRSRSLRWLPHLGRVDLELVVNGEARDFSVSPLQAAVIHHFQAQPVWDVADLAQELQVAADVARRQLGFWAGQGVLQPTDATGMRYRVREEHDDDEAAVGLSASMELDDEAGSALASGAAQDEEMWKMCHNSIKAMLVNQGSMTVEKVHMLLTMFLAEEYSATVDQLRAFMDSLVAAEEMTKEDSVYSVKR